MVLVKQGSQKEEEKLGWLREIKGINSKQIAILQLLHCDLVKDVRSIERLYKVHKRKIEQHNYQLHK